MKRVYMILFIVLLFLSGCESVSEQKLNGKIVLNCIEKGDSFIKLEWNVIPDMQGYRIYRDGKEILINANIGQYTDTQLQLGQSYTYSIVGFRGSRETEISNKVYATTKDFVYTKEITPKSGDIKWVSFSRKGNNLSYYTDYGKAVISTIDSVPQVLIEKSNIDDISAFSINEIGTRVILGNKNGIIQTLGAESVFQMQTSQLQTLSFNGNTRFISSSENEIKIWNIDSGDNGEIFKNSQLVQNKKIVWADEAYSTQESGKMAVAYEDGSVYVYYAGAFIEEIVTGNGKRNKNIKLSYDKRIMINSFEGENTVYVRNITDGKSASQWKVTTAAIKCSEQVKFLDINEDGTRIVIVDAGNTISFYDGSGILTKTMLFDINNGFINGIAVNPAGNMLAVGIEDKIKIYELK